MAEEAVFASSWCAAVPLLGVLAIVVLGWRFAKLSEKSRGAASNRNHFYKGTVFWLAIYVVVLLIIAIACAAGLYADALWKLVLFVVAAVLLAFGVALRDRCPMVKKARVGDGRRLKYSAIEVGIIVAVSLLSVWALECSYSDKAFFLAPIYLLTEFTISLCFITLLYFLAGRRGGGAAVGVLAMLFVGLAQYFLYLFKQSAITPSDVLVLGTALAVSANYEYVINGGVLQGTGIALTAICLLAYLIPWRGAARTRGAWMRHLTPALIVLLILTGFTCIPNYGEKADVKIDSWFTYDCYKRYGFLTSFVSVAQDMVVEKPEKYSTEETIKLVEDTAAQYEKESAESSDRADAQKQFEEQQPAIVCVMNETFSDLSLYNELNCGYTGPEFLNSFLDSTIISGDCSVNVIGGGTCNSEFEFLTGNNTAFFGSGMYPYSAYNFEGVENLAKQFGELGYTTTAMHPNAPTNWKRDVIYKKMGFDSFLSVNDFPAEDERIHNEVSDVSTYNKVIELLETDDSPQFIMNITMQNHSGYSRGGIPERYQTNYQPEGVDDPDLVGALNEYLGCIESSDDALKGFIADLEALDRPVVLVFFGDHQPGFSRDLNEIFFPGGSGADHQQRIYKTSYFVWANYDVEGTERFEDVDEVNISNLSALTLEIAGVPLNDFQETLLQVRKTMPTFNSFGCSDADGVWYDTEAEEEPEELEECLDLLQRAQYERFFDNE